MCWCGSPVEHLRRVVAGDAVERIRAARVTRPNQPIEYWGDCSTLRISCRGTAGTPAAAEVTCKVVSRRRIADELAVTVAIGKERYARTASSIDGVTGSI
jgi:hypothetical protein